MTTAKLMAVEIAQAKIRRLAANPRYRAKIRGAGITLSERIVIVVVHTLPPKWSSDHRADMR
jgi:GTP cyclohydrolase II